MKKYMKILRFMVVIVLAVMLFTPMAFAEETQSPAPTETSAPTEAPTTPPTEAPTEKPTEKPTDKPTEKPTEKPTKAPTQKPTETAAPAPTETATPTDDSANYVNLIMHVYNNGVAAAGYTVSVDDLSQTANKDGMVSFPEVTVEQHSVTLTDKEGKESPGKIMLSRGDNTKIQDMTMGGKYEISVANDAKNLYMSVVFTPEEALAITAVGETKTPAPEVAPTAAPTVMGAVKFTADFVDAAGKSVSGVGVLVKQGDTALGQGISDGKGRFVLSQGGIGAYQWGLIPAGGTVEQAKILAIEVQQGATTKIVSADADTYVVQTPGTSKDLYFKIEQTAEGFRLKEVSDKVVGGMSSVTIGIIAIVVIIVIVIVILSVVKHNKKKKRKQAGAYNEPRGREREFETEEEEPERVEMRPRQTGGANKFDDHSRM